MGSSDSKVEIQCVPQEPYIRGLVSSLDAELQNEAKTFFNTDRTLDLVESKEDVVQVSFSSGMNAGHMNDTIDSCFARSPARQELAAIGKEVIQLLMKSDVREVVRTTRDCRNLTIHTAEGKKHVRLQFVCGIRSTTANGRLYGSSSTLIVGYKMRLDIIQEGALTAADLRSVDLF